MPTSATSPRTTDEVVQLGVEILLRQIEPLLGPTAKGKFVAIDVDTASYEVDEDDYSAVTRLLARSPDAEIYLGCVGQAATYKMRQQPPRN